MTEFLELSMAAFKTERRISRRLARGTGLSEPRALKLTLEKIAGALGLPHLLAVRASARQAESARLCVKAQRRAALLALKKNKYTPGPAEWSAWFDGSAHPNPGRIGIGGLIVGPDGERVEIRQSAGYGNSGEAEYLALIAVLEAALRWQPAQLVIYGDSQVVINDVLQQAGAGAKGLQDQRTRVRELMAHMPAVALRWIPRHKNANADRLSQQAISLWHCPEPALTSVAAGKLGGTRCPPAELAASHMAPATSCSFTWHGQGVGDIAPCVGGTAALAGTASDRLQAIP